ncbi:hypothetical protein NEF87_003056 [Candidatus Lokiarchaeum ossiferum]|uniref:Tetratricopeptide repeat protein n=1 Tax=Candidatus Lokiarchaeum ossiferum TaxID=2951803 RepID=A0ABY6HW11_9ARCH|nr:hypothetical protein NEF87_003056 [Candidatus Lokiarchaeum sp. B-35]
MKTFIEIKQNFLELITNQNSDQTVQLEDLQAQLLSIPIDSFNYVQFCDLIKNLWNYDYYELVLKFSQRMESFFESKEEDKLHSNQIENYLYEASALACLSQMDLARSIFSNLLRDDSLSEDHRGICYSNLGIITLIEGNTEESLDFFQKSCDCFEKSQNKKNYAIGSNYLGVHFSTIGKLDNAMQMYKKGLEIKTAEHYFILLPPTYNNLGEIYYNWGEFDQASQYYELGLKFSEDNSKNPEKIFKILEDCPWFLTRWGAAPVSFISALQHDSSFFLNNLALVYRSMGENQKSLDFFKMSLETEENFSKDHNIAGILFEIIYLLTEYPDLEDISIYTKKFEDLYLKVGQKSSLIRQYFILMKGVLHRNKTDIRSIGKAMDIFEMLVNENLHNADLIKYSHLFLLESYLKELELFENLDTLANAIKISEKLEIVSKDLSNPGLFIQILIIQSKFAQIQSNFKLAKEKIRMALDIAEKKDMYRLAANIYKELQNLSKIQKVWKDIGHIKSSMAERIKMIKISPLISAISKNQSEDIASIPEFALENIKVAFFMMADIGPELMSYESMPFIENESIVLEKIAMYYSVMLGQGNSTNQGLYGPLPIPNSPNHVSIVYTFYLPNKNAQDPRLQANTYGIISFLMPEPFAKFFADREKINEKITHEISQIKDISEITRTTISNIKLALVQL